MCVVALFCRRCYIYDCNIHGSFEKPMLDIQTQKAMLQRDLEATAIEEDVLCGKDCYRTTTTTNRTFSLKDPLLRVILDRAYTIFMGDYCKMAKILNGISCRDVAACFRNKQDSILTTVCDLCVFWFVGLGFHRLWRAQRHTGRSIVDIKRRRGGLRIRNAQRKRKWHPLLFHALTSVRVQILKRALVSGIIHFVQSIVSAYQRTVETFLQVASVDLDNVVLNPVRVLLLVENVILTFVPVVLTLVASV